MKKYTIIFCLFFSLLAGCVNDKGNYNYQEMAEITIENIPELIEVLGSSDQLIVTPRILSSLEGEIKGDNPHYTFRYTLSNSERTVLSEKINLDTLASFPSGSYSCWFTVTDSRTELVTSFVFDIRVTSPTYEGWMILCNEGDENRVRMDMISQITSERIVPAYDILTPLGMPEIHGATRIGFHPTSWTGIGTVICVHSKEGGYKLNENSFETDETWNVNTALFIVPLKNEQIIYYKPFVGIDDVYGGKVVFAISDAGNAYNLISSGAGALFEDPINTSAMGKDPEYRVAPYIGMSMARPGNGNTALFYDIDNKRFVGWGYGTTDAARKCLTPLTNPDAPLFNFQTGMELVYMESTSYSNGLAYAILQDNTGKRCIYGINMSGNGFAQESKYESLNAPDFNQATAFSFHSQFPFMFYAVQNKVYLHNLGTNTTYPMNDINLSSSEVVTLLKFNLYERARTGSSEESLARQYELMVGSYNTSSPNHNGGRLGFYTVNGASNSVTKRIEYGGFAKIVDVVYRER